MDEITNNPKPMTEDVNLSDFEGNTQSEKQQWPTSPCECLQFYKNNTHVRLIVRGQWRDVRGIFI